MTPKYVPMTEEEENKSQRYAHHMDYWHRHNPGHPIPLRQLSAAALGVNRYGKQDEKAILVRIQHIKEALRTKYTLWMELIVVKGRKDRKAYSILVHNTVEGVTRTGLVPVARKTGADQRQGRKVVSLIKDLGGSKAFGKSADSQKLAHFFGSFSQQLDSMQVPDSKALTTLKTLPQLPPMKPSAIRRRPK